MEAARGEGADDEVLKIRRRWMIGREKSKDMHLLNKP